MNDFTKDELECLENAIQLQLTEKPMSQINSDMRVQLRDKLQFMIDDYTEMKIPKMASYVCSKCGEEWHQCECKND